MKKIVLFIARGRAAEIYEEDGFDAMVDAIENDYEEGLSKFEFDTENEKRAFQNGLEFCGETVGCNPFYVIGDDDVEENLEICERIS